MRNIGGHRLEFIAVPATQSDIAVFDHTTGVLFAIDQVFNQRTPHPAQCRSGAMAAIAGATQPPCRSNSWCPAMAVSRDAAPIAATRDYLDWLDATLRDAAERSLAPTEAMLLPIPERFAHWGGRAPITAQHWFYVWSL